MAEGDKSPRGVRPPPPLPDEIWCILRHNFEKCYSVSTNLVASWWFFRYSYLYTVMITIFFWGKAGHFVGGSFYPSNTLDRTLLVLRQGINAPQRALVLAKRSTHSSKKILFWVIVIKVEWFWNPLDSFLLYVLLGFLDLTHFVNKENEGLCTVR